MKPLIEDSVVAAIIELALQEDLADVGDVTGRVVPEEAAGRGVIVAREPGVLAGLPLAAEVFRRVDESVSFCAQLEDGDALERGTVIAKLAGNGRSILTAERTALNFLQRLSGIASLTQRYARIVAGTNAQVLDTRKTLPGWRRLSKYAVKQGGGANHRMGLYDQILIKDNHLALYGGESGIPKILELARQRAPEGTAVEIEVTTVAGAMIAAREGADIILLDNMAPPLLREAVAAAATLSKRPLLEASGGITLETLREVAETGVDRISVGALTHSARALDIALDLAIESP